jgi:uncharacterized membrane protein YwzB
LLPLVAQEIEGGVGLGDRQFLQLLNILQSGQVPQDATVVAVLVTVALFKNVSSFIRD